MKKISAVMCTYGRFSFVERQFNNFLNQTYPNKELIIYNTDVSSPYFSLFQVIHTGNLISNVAGELDELDVKIINSNVDSITGKPYTNVGAIRRDALKHATGDYYVCFDDDDVHLPWFMQQGIDRMQQTGKPFFKPEKSFFYSNNELRLVMNTMEASVIGSMKKIREYGYLMGTGTEGLAWYTKARDNGELDEHDTQYIPSYCFDWNSNPTNSYQHRQSGNIDASDNFTSHQKHCTDKVNGRLLSVYSQEVMAHIYSPYANFLDLHKGEFPKDLYDKYVIGYLQSLKNAS